VLVSKKMRREDVHADAFYTDADKPKVGS
jgi:hypothetical protein